MESSTMYFCHRCGQQTIPCEAGPSTLICPLCSSEFIEAINLQDASARSPFGEVQPGRRALTGENLGSIEFGLETEENEDSGMGQFVSPFQVFHRLQNSSSSFVPNQATGGHDAEIPFLFMMAHIIGPRFLTDLRRRMRQQLGPPPASEEEMKALRIRKLSATEINKYKKCVICLEPFDSFDMCIVMLCDHVYHEHCASQWFSQHGTCPICRKDMRGDDIIEDGGEAGDI
ncbi:hypothetical protein PHET_01656 [Paragonimus heterotremus]|uniref:RING-type domain-containing protein n=1 Tax=Paragonimus heterotremus TaxID=100268 RepID=A0A8J4WKD5_9TREM|nr:hypothetical protein PHET_01656 [Paragonimus heterotremus]